MNIGEKIRKLRQEEGMTRSQLARITGLSARSISRVENNETEPSLPLLINLSFILSTDITYFMPPLEEKPNPKAIIIRKDERPCYTGKQSDIRCEKLTTSGRKSKLSPWIWSMGPGNPKGVKRHSHDGEEIGIVLKGTIELVVGSKQYVLQRGDTAYFHSIYPHMFRNIGEEVAEVIWITTPAPKK